MNTFKRHFDFSQKILVLAVLAAFGPAHAEDAEDVAKLITPESSVGIGVGGVSGSNKDRAQFGIYNGMRQDRSYLLLDADVNKREDATGLWTTFEARNLGLDDRELRAGQQKQGDWKYFVEYNEITRRSPYAINTGDTGVGTTTPTVVRLAAPGTGTDIDLKTERKSVAVGGEKWINSSLLFEVSFKSEKKDGERMWGRGYDCASYVCTTTQDATHQRWALLMLAEPIDSKINQFEAKLNFHTDKLLLSAGYYGSFYTNSNGNLQATVPGSLNGPTGVLTALNPAAAGGTSLQNVLQLPMALPPDNQAHQFYVDGNYAFTPTTKTTFKLVYTRATQDDGFGAMGLTGAPAGISNLGGRVDSTLAQIGFTTRPIDKLSVLANVRYEKKDDKTPQALYNIENTDTWLNALTSNEKVAAKLEASYQLPENYRATLGVDYDSIKREVPTNILDDRVAGLGALRAKNEETGYRAELRHNLSETLNGAISYSTSKRTGSDWTSLNTTSNATYCGGVLCYGQTLPADSILGLSATAAFPMNMADVRRDKWKLSADWSPVESLSVQFMLEDGKDKNATQLNSVAGGKGWRDSGVTSYSVDASYVLSEKWKLTGYASRGDQTLHVNHSTGYMADIDETSDAAGLGLVGTPSGRLQVGANLQYLSDITKYGLAASGSATGAAPSAANVQQAAIGLPDVAYRKTTLSLFGKYALEKNADIRVDLIHERVKFKEFAWGDAVNPFVYSDNSTVSQQGDQHVTFVGATYIYKWQ